MPQKYQVANRISNKKYICTKNKAGKANSTRLFTQIKKKALAISRKCLILNVDQPGLEPGTSRL